MKFIQFSRKASVTCQRTLDDGTEVDFLTITDEGNNVLFQIHSDTDSTKYTYWFRMKKEKVFGMLGSLWPDDVAILNTDPDDE